LENPELRDLSDDLGVLRFPKPPILADQALGQIGLPGLKWVWRADRSRRFSEASFYLYASRISLRKGIDCIVVEYKLKLSGGKTAHKKGGSSTEDL
jgi:hypothetical protein